MFIKTFASSEPTLQNLKVVEVKIANVEKSTYILINTLVVLTCTSLSDQFVSIAKNQYDHLKYLKLSDFSDSKFNCNLDILNGTDYYWDFVSDNIRRGNSGPVAVETILGWALSGACEFENNISAMAIYLLPMYQKYLFRKAILITTAVFKSFSKQKVVK